MYTQQHTSKTDRRDKFDKSTCYFKTCNTCVLGFTWPEDWMRTWTYKRRRNFQDLWPWSISIAQCTGITCLWLQWLSLKGTDRVAWVSKTKKYDQIADDKAFRSFCHWLNHIFCFKILHKQKIHLPVFLQPQLYIWQYIALNTAQAPRILIKKWTE